MISIIVAYDKNLAIGKDNTLVWRQSEDLKRFKRLTSGKTVVMGRKTYESIGKPLPNRRNIVLSRQNIDIEGVEVINTFDSLNKDEDIFIIGGGEIYKNFIIFADRLYVTEIDCEIDADTWFPEIDLNIWKVESVEKHTSDEMNQFDYNFINYIKK